MNKIYTEIVKSNILHFVNDFIYLSRQVYENQKNKLIHPGEFGAYREQIVADLLRPLLPERLKVGSGFIITENGDISKQCDIIIYDSFTSPVIDSIGKKFFPIESVVGVIEVKSKLKKSELSEALVKLSETKKLREKIPNNAVVPERKGRGTSYGKTFDAENFIGDQMYTALICEEVGFDLSKSFTEYFGKTYKDIEGHLWYNAIVSIRDGCYMYFNGTQPIPYSCIDSKNYHKSMLIQPNDVSYEYEHIMLFLNYFALTITKISIAEADMTSYLGVRRRGKYTIER